MSKLKQKIADHEKLGKESVKLVRLVEWVCRHVRFSVEWNSEGAIDDESGDDEEM